MSLYARGKRKDLWLYDFEYDGVRYIKVLGRITKTKARALYEQAKTDARNGRHPLPTPKKAPSLDEALEEFLQWYRVGHAPRSIDRHERSKKRLLEFFGHDRMSAITGTRIEVYVRARRDLCRSVVTINRELGLLRHLWRWGRKRWGLRENPLEEIERFRELPRYDRVLSDQEEAGLLDQCNAHLRPLVLAALDAGCRKSELLTLTWRRVDLRRGTLTVVSGYVKNRDTRTLLMTDRLTAALRSATVSEPDALVFGYRNADKTFRRAVKRANIGRVRFHDLRHTFASRLQQAGVPLEEIQAMLGHKTLAVTQIYAHLNVDYQRKAIEVLNRRQAPTISPTLRPKG